MERILESLKSGDSVEILATLRGANLHFLEDFIEIYAELKDELNLKLFLPSNSPKWNFRQHQAWFEIGLYFIDIIDEALSLNQDTIINCLKLGDIILAEMIFSSKLLPTWPKSLLNIIKNELVLDLYPAFKKEILNCLKDEKPEYDAFHLLLNLGSFMETSVNEIIVDHITNLIIEKKFEELEPKFKALSSDKQDYFETGKSWWLSLPRKFNERLLTSLSSILNKNEIFALTEIVEDLHDRVVVITVNKFEGKLFGRGFSQFVIEEDHVKAIAIINFVSHKNGLKKIPDSISNLKFLEELTIFNNQEGFSIDFPNSFKELKSLKKLELQEVNLEENITQLIFDLYILQKSSFTELYLAMCNLKEIPDSIGKLGNLRMLCLSFNSSLDKLPQSIFKLNSLRVLKLDSCKFKEIPDSIGNLSNLEELSLAHNTLLRELPPSFSKLTALRVLDLDHTYLGEFEQLLEILRNFTKLEVLKLHLSPRIVSGISKKGVIRGEDSDRLLIKFDDVKNEIWIPKSAFYNIYAPLPNLHQEFQIKSDLNIFN